MAVDFTDIDKNLPDGQNMGGIPQLVYFALQSDVLSWPTPPTTDTENITMEKMGALVGDIKMKVGKKMNSFYITDDEGKLDFEGSCVFIIRDCKVNYLVSSILQKMRTWYLLLRTTMAIISC